MVNNKLAISQQCVFILKKAGCTLGCISMTVTSSQRQVSLPLCIDCEIDSEVLHPILDWPVRCSRVWSTRCIRKSWKDLAWMNPAFGWKLWEENTETQYCYCCPDLPSGRQCRRWSETTLGDTWFWDERRKLLGWNFLLDVMILDKILCKKQRYLFLILRMVRHWKKLPRASLEVPLFQRLIQLDKNLCDLLEVDHCRARSRTRWLWEVPSRPNDFVNLSRFV